MKQKTDVELLSEVTGLTAEFLEGAENNYIITLMEATLALDLKGKQSQAVVDELKQRCEELEKSKWISVDERLPEDYLTVLVGYGHSVALAYYVSNNKLFYDSATINYKTDVITHWQPLPSPPYQT